MRIVCLKYGAHARDPIFIPEGHTKTWGEMTLEGQAETSMRRIALKKLQKHLENL